MSEPIEVNINKLLFELHRHAKLSAEQSKSNQYIIENTGVADDKSYMGAGEYLLMVSPADKSETGIMRFNNDLDRSRRDSLDVVRLYIREFAGQKYADGVQLTDIIPFSDQFRQNEQVSESFKMMPLEDMLFSNNVQFSQMPLIESLVDPNVGYLSTARDVLSSNLISALSSSHENFSCYMETTFNTTQLSVLAISNDVDVWNDLVIRPATDIRNIRELRSAYGTTRLPPAGSGIYDISHLPGTADLDGLRRISSLFFGLSDSVTISGINPSDPTTVRTNDQVIAMIDSYITTGVLGELESVDISCADRIGTVCNSAIRNKMHIYTNGYYLRYDTKVADQKKQPLNRTIKKYFAGVGKKIWKYVGPLMKAGLGFTKDAATELKTAFGAVGNLLFGDIVSDLKSATLHTGAGDINAGKYIDTATTLAGVAGRLSKSAAKNTGSAALATGKNVVNGLLKTHHRINKSRISDWMTHVIDHEYPRSGINEIRVYTPQEIREWLSRYNKYTAEIQDWLSKGGLERIYYVIAVTVPHSSLDYNIIDKKFIFKIFEKACGKHELQAYIKKKLITLKNIIKVEELPSPYAERNAYREKIKVDLKKRCSVQISESIFIYGGLVDKLFESDNESELSLFQRHSVSEQLDIIMDVCRQDRKLQLMKYIADAIDSQTDDSKAKLKNNTVVLAATGSIPEIKNRSDFSKYLYNCSSLDEIRNFFTAYINNSTQKKVKNIFSIIYDCIIGIKSVKNQNSDNVNDKNYDTYFIFSKYVQDVKKEDSKSQSDNGTLDIDSKE